MQDEVEPELVVVRGGFQYKIEPGIVEAFNRYFNKMRAEDIDHLYCGHCGGIDDVKEVEFHEAKRALCLRCREYILEWI